MLQDAERYLPKPIRRGVLQSAVSENQHGPRAPTPPPRRTTTLFPGGGGDAADAAPLAKGYRLSGRRRGAGREARSCSGCPSSPQRHAEPSPQASDVPVPVPVPSAYPMLVAAAAAAARPAPADRLRPSASVTPLAPPLKAAAATAAGCRAPSAGRRPPPRVRGPSFL